MATNSLKLYILRLQDFTGIPKLQNEFTNSHKCVLNEATMFQVKEKRDGVRFQLLVVLKAQCNAFSWQCQQTSS